jgi:hypothetical protein
MSSFGQPSLTDAIIPWLKLRTVHNGLNFLALCESIRVKDKPRMDAKSQSMPPKNASFSILWLIVAKKPSKKEVFCAS